jgi:methionine-rich copper-binding protein CopC
MLLRIAARSGVRAVLVLAFALLLAAGWAGPASAHATLIGSDPADGAVVPAAPAVVTLTFDDSLEDFEPVLTVTGPDGTQYQTGAATIDGAKLSTAVGPLPAAGTYTVAYRVVSDDGHPVEGQTHFELAPPAAGAAAPGPVAGSAQVPAASTSTGSSTAAPSAPTGTTAAPPTVTSGTDTAAASSSGGWTAWQWLLVALFVVLAAGASMLVRRRMAANARSRSGGDD